LPLTNVFQIPAAWFLAFAPHIITVAVGKSIDKTAPRTYADALAKDQTLDKAVRLNNVYLKCCS
jgi:hypothetical protein